MSGGAPSNPSPFSAELQTFIVSKYDPLLAIVRELSDHITNADQDRWRLERRVNQLEEQLKALRQAYEDGVFVHEAEASLDAAEKGTKQSSVREMLRSEETLNAPWLFSCQTGTALSAVQVLLEYSPDCTEELDVRLWSREEDMWIALLEDLPEVVVAKPDSLHLPDLRKCARKALVQLCKSEFCLMLRGVPGKEAAATNVMGITLVAILAAAFSEAWQRVEAQDPDYLGRIAVILEGDSIGTRLRGGRQKFQIEALN